MVAASPSGRSTTGDASLSAPQKTTAVEPDHPLLTARCAALRRPLDQVGFAILSGCLTIVVLIGAGAVLRELDLGPELELGGAFAVAFSFLIASLFHNRFRNRLLVFADGVAIMPPPDGLPGKRDFLPFAHLHHLGRDGKRLTLAAFDPDRGRPVIRTAILSRFRVEDVYDLIHERLQESAPGRRYSLRDRTELAESRPPNPEEVTSAETLRVTAQHAGPRSLRITTDRGERFAGRFDEGSNTAQLVRKSAPESDETILHATVWGIFTSRGYLFAILGFVSDSELVLRFNGDKRRFRILRKDRKIIVGHRTVGAFRPTTPPEALDLVLEEALIEEFALSMLLVWLQWNSLCYAFKMI